MQEEIKPTHRAAPPESGHCSVLLTEAVQALQPVRGGFYVDATFGNGGHTQAILAASAPDGQVLALDRDPAAILRGQHLVKAMPERLTLVHTPFGQLGPLLAAHQKMGKVDGILFDVGLSSQQLDTPQRGFSFRLDGPLDMRMDDSTNSSTAADLVNQLTSEALADIFFHYGEERLARKAARAIVEQRTKTPFTTTRQLATLLEKVLPRNYKIHPATRIFQALRIAVNQELDELTTGLTATLPALALQGRIVVITFHSLEDRIVKQTFRQAALPPPPPTGPAALLRPSREPFRPQFGLPITKPLIPGPEEIQHNPRARSAKMRVIQRLLPPLDATPKETVV